LGLDFAHDVGRKASLVKGFNWFGNISTLNRNTMECSEFGDLSTRSGSDVGIFLVKRFFEFRKAAKVCRISSAWARREVSCALTYPNFASGGQLQD
jgi:hypothetical protein